MKPLVRLSVAVLVVGALIGAGCGDDDGGEGLTQEEFFLEPGVLDDEYSAATAEAEAGLEQEIAAVTSETSEQERIEIFVDFVEESGGVLEDFIDGVAQLDAPDELAEWQSEAVSAGRAAIEALDEAMVALGDVTTDEELEAVLFEGGTEEAFEAFNSYCFEAEELAAEAGVDVDYDCDDD